MGLHTARIDNLFWVCTSKNPFSRKKELIWWVTVVKSCGEIKLVIIPFHIATRFFFLFRQIEILTILEHFKIKKSYIIHESFKERLIKKVQKMELNNPVIQTLLGLVVFYIGLKMFSGGMKAMGNIDHLQWFLGNPIYMFFGGIVMTLLCNPVLYQLLQLLVWLLVVHYLYRMIGAVLGANNGTTGTIWIAGLLVSDGMPTGITKHIPMVHTGVNLFMAVLFLPFVQHIAKFVSKF